MRYCVILYTFSASYCTSKIPPMCRIPMLITVLWFLSLFSLVHAQAELVEEQATFAGGCFWCTEAIFTRFEGVKSVVSGYAGGQGVNPTYQQVSSGTSGHAEVVQITFLPSLIDYEELLQVFFRTHDPTTLNRQGNDVGTQYRSAVFYHNAIQQKRANDYIDALRDANTYKDPIVTEVTAMDKFYVAENYHQNYYEANRSQPYCRFVIAPKLAKAKKLFPARFKEVK